jgi:hypothetical protein
MLTWLCLHVPLPPGRSPQLKACIAKRRIAKSSPQGMHCQASYRQITCVAAARSLFQALRVPVAPAPRSHAAPASLVGPPLRALHHPLPALPAAQPPAAGTAWAQQGAAACVAAAEGRRGGSAVASSSARAHCNCHQCVDAHGETKAQNPPPTHPIPSARCVICHFVKAPTQASFYSFFIIPW